jgi:hypothetical protein
MRGTIELRRQGGDDAAASLPPEAARCHSLGVSHAHPLMSMKVVAIDHKWFL